MLLTSMHPPGGTLATAFTLFTDILPWLLALAALVVIGGACIYAARRLLQSDDPGVSEGFTLHSLRELHAAGELSDEEFERAKAAMIGRVRQAASEDVRKEDEAPTSEADAASQTDNERTGEP